MSYEPGNDRRDLVGTGVLESHRRDAGATPVCAVGGGEVEARTPGSPRISIVTVCLNQSATIESALQSVLDQLGPDDEYIVIDGGSTDGTRERIARYADRLTHLVSEPDRGQSHALNKGFARATGDVVGWLNGDDLLLPGALARVRAAFGDSACDVLCGACRYEYADTGEQIVRTVPPREFRQLAVYDPIHQPSCFWRRSWHEHVGGLDESLAFGMDWDLWLRLDRAGARFRLTDELLSVYRVTGVNKTSTGGDRRNREMATILRRYSHGLARCRTEIAYRLLWPLKRLRTRRPTWLFRPLSNIARTACLIALAPFFSFDAVRRSTHPFS